MKEVGLRRQQRQAHKQSTTPRSDAPVPVVFRAHNDDLSRAHFLFCPKNFSLPNPVSSDEAEGAHGGADRAPRSVGDGRVGAAGSRSPAATTTTTPHAGLDGDASGMVEAIIELRGSFPVSSGVEASTVGPREPTAPSRLPTRGSQSQLQDHFAGGAPLLRAGADTGAAAAALTRAWSNASLGFGPSTGSYVDLFSLSSFVSSPAGVAAAVAAASGRDAGGGRAATSPVSTAAPGSPSAVATSGGGGEAATAAFVAHVLTQRPRSGEGEDAGAAPGATTAATMHPSGGWICRAMAFGSRDTQYSSGAISVNQSLTSKCPLVNSVAKGRVMARVMSNYREVEEAYGLSHLELAFEYQFVSRGDMFLVTEALRERILYHGEELTVCGFRFKVSEMLQSFPVPSGLLGGGGGGGAAAAADLTYPTASSPIPTQLGVGATEAGHPPGLSSSASASPPQSQQPASDATRRKALLQVNCGLVTTQTVVNFLSLSPVHYIIVELAAEMWDTMFDGRVAITWALRRFLRELLLVQLPKRKATPLLRIVFTGRLRREYAIDGNTDVFHMLEIPSLLKSGGGGSGGGGAGVGAHGGGSPSSTLAGLGSATASGSGSFAGGYYGQSSSGAGSGGGGASGGGASVGAAAGAGASGGGGGGSSGGGGSDISDEIHWHCLAFVDRVLRQVKEAALTRLLDECAQLQQSERASSREATVEGADGEDTAASIFEKDLATYLREGTRRIGRLAARHIFSPAKESNTLEALSVVLERCSHHYLDRRLADTGHAATVVSAGKGIYQVTNSLVQVNCARLHDVGIRRVHMVCMGRPPLHMTPLFEYASDDETLRSQYHLLSGDGGGGDLLRGCDPTARAGAGVGGAATTRTTMTMTTTTHYYERPEWVHVFFYHPRLEAGTAAAPTFDLLTREDWALAYQLSLSDDITATEPSTSPRHASQTTAPWPAPTRVATVTAALVGGQHVLVPGVVLHRHPLPRVVLPANALTVERLTREHYRRVWWGAAAGGGAGVWRAGPPLLTHPPHAHTSPASSPQPSVRAVVGSVPGSPAAGARSVLGSSVDHSHRRDSSLFVSHSYHRRRSPNPQFAVLEDALGARPAHRDDEDLNHPVLPPALGSSHRRLTSWGGGSPLGPPPLSTPATLSRAADSSGDESSVHRTRLTLPSPAQAHENPPPPPPLLLGPPPAALSVAPGPAERALPAPQSERSAVPFLSAVWFCVHDTKTSVLAGGGAGVAGGRHHMEEDHDTYRGISAAYTQGRSWVRPSSVTRTDVSVCGLNIVDHDLKSGYLILELTIDPSLPGVHWSPHVLLRDEGWALLMRGFAGRDDRLTHLGDTPVPGFVSEFRAAEIFCRPFSGITADGRTLVLPTHRSGVTLQSPEVVVLVPHPTLFSSVPDDVGGDSRDGGNAGGGAGDSWDPTTTATAAATTTTTTTTTALISSAAATVAYVQLRDSLLFAIQPIQPLSTEEELTGPGAGWEDGLYYTYRALRAAVQRGGPGWGRAAGQPTAAVTSPTAAPPASGTTTTTTTTTTTNGPSPAVAVAGVSPSGAGAAPTAGAGLPPSLENVSTGAVLRRRWLFQHPNVGLELPAVASWSALCATRILPLYGGTSVYSRDCFYTVSPHQYTVSGATVLTNASSTGSVHGLQSGSAGAGGGGGGGLSFGVGSGGSLSPNVSASSGAALGSAAGRRPPTAHDDDGRRLLEFVLQRLQQQYQIVVEGGAAAGAYPIQWPRAGPQPNARLEMSIGHQTHTLKVGETAKTISITRMLHKGMYSNDQVTHMLSYRYALWNYLRDGFDRREVHLEAQVGERNAYCWEALDRWVQGRPDTPIPRGPELWLRPREVAVALLPDNPSNPPLFDEFHSFIGYRFSNFLATRGCAEWQLDSRPLSVDVPAPTPWVFPPPPETMSVVLVRDSTRAALETRNVVDHASGRTIAFDMPVDERMMSVDIVLPPTYNPRCHYLLKVSWLACAASIVFDWYGSFIANAQRYRFRAVPISCYSLNPKAESFTVHVDGMSTPAGPDEEEEAEGHWRGDEPVLRRRLLEVLTEGTYGYFPDTPVMNRNCRLVHISGLCYVVVPPSRTVVARWYQNSCVRQGSTRQRGLLAEFKRAVRFAKAETKRELAARRSEMAR